MGSGQIVRLGNGPSRPGTAPEGSLTITAVTNGGSTLINVNNRTELPDEFYAQFAEISAQSQKLAVESLGVTDYCDNGNIQDGTQINDELALLHPKPNAPLSG
jgi:hypothetical protein